MTQRDHPWNIHDTDEIYRKARRDFPQPYELNAAFVFQREVTELRRMVESNASERDLDTFIKGEPNLLSSLLDFANTGHHGGMVYPQQTIRPSVPNGQKGLVPDYLISGKSSDGTSWWVLELKGPSESIFSGRDNTLRLSDSANKGLVQIHKYIEYCTEHQSAIRDSLQLTDFHTPMGILLIGRESELNDPQRREMKRSLGGPTRPIRIRTWDSLLRSLNQKLAIFGRIEKDALQDSQIEE